LRGRTTKLWLEPSDSALRHNPPVPWRRFLLFAVLLLVAGSLVSAMTPHTRHSGGTPSSEVTPAPTNRPASVVEASLPADRDVRARVGDVVRLTVSAPSADVVELADLALEQPVDAGVPAELVFVADQAGRFRIRLRDAGESVGTLRVSG
jgi:hypothetical protein